MKIKAILDKFLCNSIAKLRKVDGIAIIELTAIENVDKKTLETVCNKLVPKIVTDDWHDDLITGYKFMLEYIGILDPDIKYSGFWSQGDGASFTTHCFDLQKFLDNINTFPEFKNLFTDGDLDYIKEIISLYPDLEIAIVRKDSHYAHKNTVRVITYGDNDDERVNTGLQAFLNTIKDRLCNWIYKDLEAKYDELTSNDAIIDWVVDNRLLIDTKTSKTYCPDGTSRSREI